MIVHFVHKGAEIAKRQMTYLPDAGEYVGCGNKVYRVVGRQWQLTEKPGTPGIEVTIPLDLVRKWGEGE